MVTEHVCFIRLDYHYHHNVSVSSTECLIRMSGFIGRGVTDHSGSLLINGSQVSSWESLTGILLFRLGHTCGLEEIVKFDVSDIQNFTNYINAQSRNTLLIGLSGDFKMLKMRVTRNLLQSLRRIQQNSVYGFVLKIGFPSISRVWKRRYGVGYYSISTSVTQGTF